MALKPFQNLLSLLTLHRLSGAWGQGQEGKKEHDACSPACGDAGGDGAEERLSTGRRVGRKCKEGVGEVRQGVAQKPRLNGTGEEEHARGGAGNDRRGGDDRNMDMATMETL